MHTSIVPRAVPWIRQHSKPLLPSCPICREPVELETSKADEYGQAIHDECYMLKLHLNMPQRKAHTRRASRKVKQRDAGGSLPSEQ